MLLYILCFQTPTEPLLFHWDTRNSAVAFPYKFCVFDFMFCFLMNFQYGSTHSNAFVGQRFYFEGIEIITYINNGKTHGWLMMFIQPRIFPSWTDLALQSLTNVSKCKPFWIGHPNQRICVIFFQLDSSCTTC